MNKYFYPVALSLLFTGWSIAIKAQNLVLNPSFENVTSCPQTISELYLAVDWSSTNTGADTCSSPDLYNTCSPTTFPGTTITIPSVNVPNNILGYRQAHSGNGYAGIILAEGFPLLCAVDGSNYREYLEGQLSSPLVAGQKYCVKFYMSLAQDAMFGTSNIGVYFSNSFYQHDACPDNALINLTPQLRWCGASIMDTSGWAELKWTYTASGGENYLTIGNFDDDGSTHVTSFNCESFNPYAYYYVDDVSVVAGCCADSIIFSDVVLPGCGNSGTATASAYSVTCGSSGFTYNWSDGSTTQNITVTSGNTYTVTVSSGGGCSTTASVDLNTTNALQLSSSKSNPTCGSQNGSAIITVTRGDGPFTYSWNNGSTASSIDSLTGGSYIVTVSGSFGCSAIDTILLHTASNVSLSQSSTNPTCGNSNGTITLNPTGGNPPYNFNWSNGSTTQSLTGLAPGTYSVSVLDDTTSGVFYFQDFSGASGWTLNQASGGNGAIANEWIINNNSSCTCTSGNTLHITCDSSAFFCAFSQGQCTYINLPPLDGDPTTDKFCSSPNISTIGKTNIVLNFTYMSGGYSGSDYGLVRLSADGGTTWTDLPTQYLNQTNCTLASVNIPSIYENITTFKIGFRWINGANGNENDPGFSIDSVSLSASSSHCPAVDTIVLRDSSTLAFTLNPTDPSCGQSNGSISVSISSGPGLYTFAWSNDSTGQSVHNLAAGSYSVTVSLGGCTQTATQSIASSNALSFTQSITNASCSGNNGAASVNVLQPGSYNYSWNTGATTQGISNVGAGTYTVTVSGTGGCTGIDTITILTGGGIFTSINGVNTTCGNNNGSASVYASGGTGTYTYSWNSGNTTDSISNLHPGTYKVTVQDGGGCTAVDSVLINPSGSTPVSLNASKTSICSGDSSRICAPAGYISYAWNNGDTTACIEALYPGNYYVTVTDFGHCSATSTPVSIQAFPPPQVAITVNGDTLSVGASSSYHWYLNDSLLGVTGNVLIASQPGSYTVAVTDTNGCAATSNAVVLKTVGIDFIGENSSVKVYPNPTSTGWQLQVSADWLDGLAELFDNNGRLVAAIHITSLTSTLDEAIAKGVYVLRLTSLQHQVNLKVVKL